MQDLGPNSTVLVVFVAWQGPVTIAEVTNATGMSLLAVLGILPRLVENGYIDRDGNTLTRGTEPAINSESMEG